MNLFRLSIIAVSAALTFSVGSSASTANTSYSHPEFSVAENRTLNLRETGSQIVVETIENALRAGGLALLGEGFQLDSSLSYHSGDNEGIEGGLDVVVPLLNLGRHVVFAQPGAVFWTGLEEEERVDGNIGLVYRAELIRDLVAGASVFYDHDFQIGHSRISGGIDLQSGFFRFGANYYHPLGEEEDGREGFIEEALRGMDARLVFEREVVRLGSTVGYWEYDGGEDVEDEWKTSIGVDFGFRILPGVFMEGSWERHKDDLVLDERIFAGLAFRFSLPDFEGGSYGNGEMSSNLHKIVDREKRILYEEREADGILLLPDGSVVEGGTVNVAVQLRKAATEDVVINLVGSGSATYNDDYTVSVGGTNCTAVTGTSCSITITAGETIADADVVITINNDGRGEGAETIILSTVVASGDASLTGRSLVLTIPMDPPLPRVSIVRTGSGSVAEGGTVELDIRLSEALEENVTVNLVGSNSMATYGSSNDWALSVGGTDCTGVANDECQVSITAGQTSAVDDVVIAINDDGRTNELAENIVLSIMVDSGSTHLVQAGNPFTLTIPADPPLPTVNLSSNSTSITEGNTATITLTLSEPLGSNATFNLINGGGATYGTSNDWNLSVGGTDCGMATQTNPCQVTISQGQRTAEATVEVNTDMTDEATAKNFTVSFTVDSGSTSLVTLGSQSSLPFTIPADLPTVSFNYGGNTNINTQSTLRMRIDLNRAASDSITLNIVGTGTAVGNYEVGGGTAGGSGSWDLYYRVLSAGMPLPDFFVNGTPCTSIAGTGCPIVVTAGQTTVDIEVNILLIPSGRTITLTLGSTSLNLVKLGSSSTHTLTIN